MGMAKSVVLTEAEYLDLVNRTAFWKTQFERRRERDRDLETKLKDGNAEIRQLKKQLTADRQEHSQVVAALKRELVKMADEIDKLKAQLETQRKMIFGSRSEQKKDPESSKEPSQTGAPPKIPTRKRGKQKGSKGKGRRRRENLKEEKLILDLGNEEKICTDCGLPYCRSQKTEESCHYEWRVEMKRIKVVRYCYIRGCNCKSSSKFKVAPKMAKPIPKGMFAANLLAKVLTYHFALQIPVNRIMTMMEMEGLDVSQGTLTGVLKKLHPLFQPLYQEILKKAHDSSHWHMDETTWRMLCSPTKKRWWLWVVSTSECVCFIMDPSRSAKIPQAFFGEEAEGILSVDRYAAYKGLGAKIRLAFCWAHVRRDFLRVEAYPKLKNWGASWVKRIAKLYKLNRARLRAEAGSKAREKIEKALKKQIEAIERWYTDELKIKKLHPQRAKILKSLKRHWQGLTLFVAHPWVPMDNNEAERCLRNAVVGRKIYYGSGAEWSAELSAWLFSLFETLKKNNVDTLAYLTEYLEACAQAGGVAPKDLSPFLPWNRNKEKEKEEVA